jgi:ABC-type lipoprotein release transport system permease subunit
MNFAAFTAYTGPESKFMKAILSFYSDALKIALQSIFAHKLRAFLTLIGIIIGVASVVTVGASISGLNTYVVERSAKFSAAITS